MKNFYVETLAECIRRQCQSASTDGSRLQFMVPEISGHDAILLLAACEDIAVATSRTLVFRVADECRNASDWSESDCNSLSNHFAGGNLTQYRNEIEDGHLIVLLGTDLTTDRGSLEDFYQCSAEALFTETMKKSFSFWVSPWLTSFGVDPTKDWLKAWDEVLGIIADDTSLPYVSQLLSSIHSDTGIGSEQEAMEILLRKFGPNLSSFAKYARKTGKRTFRYYVNAATAFFNYGTFLEESAREKAVKAIDDYEKMDPPPELDTAPFASREEFLSVLRDYILQRDTKRLDDLRKADFLTINDQILKAKPPKSDTSKEPKDTLQKLFGSPLEVLLLGAWRTLAQFATMTRDGEYAGVLPELIKFEGKHFRHDLPELGTSDEMQELCREYLQRLLGGLDGMLSRIRIQPNREQSDVAITISSDLIPDEISVKSAKSSEPYFEFHITVAGPGGMPQVRRRFALRLPDIHPYRLASDLLEKAHNVMERYSQEVGLLPVFHLPYYRELMLSREGEETSRVFDAALRALNDEKFLTNIFTPAWRMHESTKPMRGLLDELSKKFREFLRECRDIGLYEAIGKEATIPFVKAFTNAVEAFTFGGGASSAPIGATDARDVGAMLMRAFLFVDEERENEPVDTWGVETFEQSAIVTILHPALVEMLQAQWVFLLESFGKTVTAALLGEHGDKVFKKDRFWTSYADLADIKAPLVGLPVRQSGKFVVTNSASGLVFRIGELPAGSEMAATRFLTRYNDIDDDEIADEELLHETSESRLLCRMLCDFFRLHAGAKDGMSLVVYRNEDIQPILAGIDAYIRFLEKNMPTNNRAQKYSIRLVVYSESSDTSVVAQWLTAWQDYVESKDDGSSSYADCKLSVSHRLVGKGGKGIAEFANAIREDVDADIFVFYDFIRPDAQGCIFEKAKPYDVTKQSIKFPILEQSQCASTKPSEQFRRSQIVSNRQFRVADAHANLSNRVKDPGISPEDRHIVLATGDYKPWQDVIDAAHEAAEWVVAIDPLVDRALVEQKSDGGPGRKRELIGFGSGVGQHGESNYTVSTQQYRLGELKNRLLSAMRGVFPYGSPIRDERIAQTLLDEAQGLSGISIVRALGPGEYVRDFLAYAILHRIVPFEEEEHLCDKLFSIDAYRHWFDLAADDNQHPDLLWLRANIDSDQLHLNATLIECKMGKSQNMPEHLEKAKTQIENGLRVLMPLFAPSRESAFSRPDQRYWFLQLHRMIASAAPTSWDKSAFLIAMENLAEGDFTIEWDAAIYTFVTDETRNPELKMIDILPVVPEKEGDTFSVPVFQSGYAFIDAICQPEAKHKLVWKDSIDLTAGTTTVDYDIREDRLLEEDDEVESENDSARHDFDYDDNIEITTQLEDDEAFVPKPAIVPPVLPHSQIASDTVAIPKQTPVSEHILETISTSEPEPLAKVPKPMPMMTENNPSPASGMAPATTAIPDRILLGKTKTGKEVFWEFGHPKLNNRHFLIFGNSGTGKTYAIQSILAELARNTQNSLIVDYTNGFLNRQLVKPFVDSVKPLQYIVKRDGLPINPFRRGIDDDGCGGTLEESEWDVASRVTSIFDSVYNLGDQQRSVLIDAIQAGMGTKPDFGMSNLIHSLETFIDDGVHQQAALKSVISKLKPFVGAKLFNDGESIGWNAIFTDKDSLCQVFQMTMLDRTTYLLLTEFVLWDLYSTARMAWDETHPHVIVLDEVQNLDQKLDSPLGKFLTEGRKFGLCLIAATQTLSNLKDDEKARLFQATHKLFFKPADSELKRYSELVRTAAQTGTADEWKARLSSLVRGECISIGPAREGDALKVRVNTINITSLEDRGF